MRYDMAPLEGVTTYIYRKAHAHYFGGVDRYYTPFLSPHKDKTLNHKEIQDVMPEHNEGLDVVPQILTASAQDFLKTAQELAQMGYTQVNLNCGCPSATVTSKHKGAGMLEDTLALTKFLDEIYEKSPIPVSIKTRIGIQQWQEWMDLLEVYRRFPVSELIIHPRVRQDFYKNTPHLEAVEEAFERLDCPICYNGDIFNAGDYDKIRKRFPKLQACMLGRGLIADPGLAIRIRTGKNMDKKTLRLFHDEVLNGYRNTLSGDKNALYRMKELWFYMSRLFAEPDKYRKKIQKAEKMAVYESAVDSLFREQELISTEENRFVF